MRRNKTTQSAELWNAVTGEGYFFPPLPKRKCCGCGFMSFNRQNKKPVFDPKCPLK